MLHTSKRPNECRTAKKPRGKRSLLSLLATPLIAALLLSLTAIPQAARAAQICAAPGSSGPASISGILNGYYPGRASVGAGATTLPVGSIDPRGITTPVAAGDLLVVIQVQDAAINGSNSASYGGSAPGQGYTFLNSAGAYEYVTASGPASGGSIPITSGLINSYTSSSASSFQGQRSFQVIRVPQYSSATLTGMVTAPPWNGATGGAVVLEVAGNLSWSGQSIDVSARGFRGGAAQQSISNGTGETLANTDYVSSLGTGTLGIATASGTVPHGAKGEGIAGTPIIVFVPATPNNGNTAGSVLNTGGSDGTSGGYPGGSFARGAPGNAGGGGSDGDPPANDQNTGGGGGGNYGSGGTGGFGWTPGTPPGSQTGGVGGGSVPDSPSRLFFGGGGGAGTTNNGTTSGYGILTSGASGGGVVLVRCGSVTGSGTINANGGTGNIIANPLTNTAGAGIMNDASGGGGAGGSVLVFVNNGGASTGATINVNGGQGGNNAPGAGVNPHGPGGGGSGGYAVLSGSATVNYAGGANGITNTSAYTTADYGSTTSPGGYTMVNLGPASIPGISPSPTCYPRMVVTKTTATPNVNQGGTVSYTITASNLSGYGTAAAVTISDILPASPNFSYAATTSVVLAGGATRTAISNPTAGTPTPSWGSFSIPGGGSVTVTFTVNVALATPLAVYQNPASVTYSDPTATNAGQTVTPGGSYAGGGTVLGSNYDPASSTGEDVTVRSPASFAKSFNPTSISVGGTTVLTVVINNPTPLNFSNAGFTDSYPAGMVNAVTPAASTTCAGGTVTAAAGGTSFGLSGATVPTGGSCQVQVTVTAPVSGPFTNTIASGALTDNENITNVVAGSATLQARPTITKAFSPIAVPQGTSSTLTFTISNANASALSGIAFSDSYPAGLTNAATLVTGGSCTGVTLDALTKGGGNVFNVTGGSVPAAGSCTITVLVQSASAGNYPNTTSGVTSTLNPTPALAGLPSNTAALGVGLVAISKTFSSSPISLGGTSTVILTLTNPTGVPQTGGSFADPLANMSISANQTVGGSCTGVTPSALSAGQTALSFSGINIPAAGCTMSYSVTSSQAGSNPNTTTGVSTALLPVGPPSNTAQLVVIQKPTIAKAFVSPYFQPGGSSSLVFTIANPNSVPLTGINFTDSYPANLTNTAALSIGGTCAGVTVSGTTVGGGSAFNVSGGSVPALSSCTISVQVTSSVVGTYNNTASGVASVESGSAGLASNTATLNVVTPPAITAKSFTPALINQNGISTVSFTLQNNNPIALSNLNFSDALTNMTVANASIGGTCLGTSNSPALVAGATALNLTVPTLAAGASCTVTAQLTSSVSGANPNQTSGATATESPVAGAPSPIARLNVLYPPLLAKSFVPGQISVGGSTTLTFNVSNPNAAALTNVHFTDAMTSMTLASTSFSKTCSGAVSFSPALAAGATQVNPTLSSLNANESCTISVTVTSGTISPAAGLPNTTSGATSTETPLAGAAASTTLDVLGPAGIAKSFSAATMQAGGSSTITFTLSNPNASVLTGASFSDSFPAGMTTTLLAQTYTGGARGTCTGTIPNSKTTTTGDASVSFAGINIPASGSCTVLVDVTAATAGSYINTVSGVTSTQVPTAGATASATLNVLAAPTITKGFSPSTIAAGGSSALTLTITNPNATALSGVAVSDSYPANLVNLNTTVANSCNGTATASANATNPGTLKLTGGTLAANASCTISVSVTSASAGSYANTTGGVTSTQTPTAGPSATDTLTVVAAGTNRLIYTKTFSQPQVQAGPVTAATLNMVFTISNLSPGTAAQDIQFNAADTMPTAGGAQMFLANGASNSCTITAASPALSCSYNSLTANGTVVTNIAASTTSLNFGTAGTGLRLAATSSCTVTCPVTIPAATTGGTYTNTAAYLITGTGAFTTTSGDSASVVALKAPTISQAFSPATVGAGSSSTLTFTLGNSSNPSALSNATFSDTLANMTVAGAQSAGGTCGGVNSNSFVNGQTALTLTGLTLPASGTCTVTLSVTSSTIGANANAASGVSSTQTPAAGAAAASANLTVVGTTLTKAFAPVTVRTGQSSTLTFTVTNGTGKPAQSGLAFTETLPGGVVVANPANSSTTCGGGTITGGSGSGTVALSNGSMLLNQTSCVVQVDVVSASAGSYNNLPANVTGSSSGMTNSVNATLTVYNNAVMTKAFAPAVIGMNGTSTLTFTISNGSGAPLQSGLGFTDSYPVGVLNTGAAATSVGCGAPTITATGATGLITVSGVQVAAAPASCTISIPVTAAAAGSYPNSSAGNITGLAGGLTANGLSSTLNVVGATLSKSFAPATVQIGTNSTLTLTISNGAGNPAQSALSFTDTLPAGLVIATPNGLSNGCGGTVTATAGSSVITLPAGSLAASAASCTVTVNTVAAAAGTYTNSSANISGVSGNLDASAANATVNYLAPAGILKSFSPAIIAPGGTSTMTFTISNTNSIPLTGAGFTDTLVNISSSLAQAATGSCGGVAGNNFALGQTGFLSFSNLTVQPGGCTVSIVVTSALPGNQYNTASGVTTTQTTIGAASNSAQLTVTSLPPATTKSFGAAAIPAGGTTTLVLTLSNPTANPSALTTVLVDDAFPAGLILQNTVFSFAPAACGSVSKTTGAASAPGDNNARFSVASLASGATCQVTLNVTSSTAGPITNTTLAPSAAGPTAVSGAAASAALNVLAQPLISVLKSADVASANPGQVITYTVQIVNSGAGAGSNVVLTDDMSPYGSFSMVTPFTLVDSSPVSGLTLGVPQYSFNNGTSWAYALVSGAGGAPANYDGAVTNWRIPMTGTIRAGGSCIINYKIMVK